MNLSLNKCRYELKGHTLLLDHWLLRYGLALLASPRLASPGRLTCEMLRPDFLMLHFFLERAYVSGTWDHFLFILWSA